MATTIAQQREQGTLISTLLSILEEYFPQYQADLYDLVSQSPIQVCLHTGKDVFDITEDQLLKTCYDSQTPAFTEIATDHYRYVYVVHGVGTIKHLLDIQGPTLNGDQHFALQQLLILFNSQYLLLDKNDHDALTGLLNRHAFEERLEQLVLNHQRRENKNSSDYCFALLDIDHFKRVNDNYGHLYGDEVLILFARIMEQDFRHEDMLFRYGGEEFAVVLKDIKLEQAGKVLNRFRKSVANFPFSQVGQMTVSIGYANTANIPNAIELIARADKALYYSKENGRNQVNAFETLCEQGQITAAPKDSHDIELF